jgi:hypothetical protein
MSALPPKADIETLVGKGTARLGGSWCRVHQRRSPWCAGHQSWAGGERKSVARSRRADCSLEKNIPEKAAQAAVATQELLSEESVPLLANELSGFSFLFANQIYLRIRSRDFA